MALKETFQNIAVYFGLAEDPEAAATRAPERRDEVAEQLAALDRRVADNTAAVEAMRAELMRLSAKL